MSELSVFQIYGVAKKLCSRHVQKKRKGLTLMAAAKELLNRNFGVLKNKSLFYRNYYKKLA
jgi:hypothetical protein